MKFDAADLYGSALQVAVEIIRKAGFFADVRGAVPGSSLSSPHTAQDAGFHP